MKAKTPVTPVTKEQISEFAKKHGFATRERFYSFDQYANPIVKGQYNFARIKKQKSKELKHLNKLFHELVLDGVLVLGKNYRSYQSGEGWRPKVWHLRIDLSKKEA